MEKIIAVLAGDGIGLEIVPQAVRILNSVKEYYDLPVKIIESEIGGSAYDLHGSHFPSKTKELCQIADAVLFGSVGGPVAQAHLPKWKDAEVNSILALRKFFNLNANLRPVRIYPFLAEKSPLKNKVIQYGVDILFVRELLGDIYFGEHTRYTESNIRKAHDIAIYDETLIEKVAHTAFQVARQRRHKVTSVDKANVLMISKLWREVMDEVSRHYSDVEFEHMLVDNCGMQLVINPSQFDVIVTSNMFGDILSDTAAALPGSLGLIPSASINEKGIGLYEPAGGSAPDIAGKNCANPIAQILSLVMMLRFSFHWDKPALSIENAIEKSLQEGYRTQDIFEPGNILVGTKELTDKIIENLAYL